MSMPKDQRLVMLRKQLRKSLLERDAALEEIASFRKKERLHVLKQKQAALAIARVTELERTAGRKEREAAQRTREADAFADEASSWRRKCSQCVSAPPAVLVTPGRVLPHPTLWMAECCGEVCFTMRSS